MHKERVYWNRFMFSAISFILAIKNKMDLFQ